MVVIKRKKRRTIVSLDKDVEKKEPSYIADGRAKWYSCYGKCLVSLKSSI